MTEPPRRTDLDEVKPDLKRKGLAILRDLEGHGFDPIIFEALRTKERQAWLYGKGRTHHLEDTPVTWKRRSRHQDGDALDIIDRKDGWGNAAFFAALKSSALAHGLRDYRGKKAFDSDGAHVQTNGG